MSEKGHRKFGVPGNAILQKKPCEPATLRTQGTENNHRATTPNRCSFFLPLQPLPFLVSYYPHVFLHLLLILLLHLRLLHFLPPPPHSPPFSLRHLHRLTDESESLPRLPIDLHMDTSMLSINDYYNHLL